MTTYSKMRDDFTKLADRAFDTRSHQIIEGDSLAISIFPVSQSDGVDTVQILVQADLVPPADLQYLAWGVVDGDWKLHACGRTNERGILTTELPTGQYHIRYVGEVNDGLDRKILEAIGDLEAQSMLSDSVLSPPSPTLAIPWVGFDESNSTSMAVVPFDSEKTQVGGEAHGITNRGSTYFVRIQLDPESNRFPFSVAVVSLSIGGETRLHFIPLAIERSRDGNTAFHVGNYHFEVPLQPAELDRPPELMGLTANGGELSHRFTSDDLGKLLSDPLVESDDELFENVNRLTPFASEEGNP